MARGGKRRGRQAALVGKYAEDTVESIFVSAGYDVITFDEWESQQISPCVVKQYPVPHPYRTGRERAGKNDFMLINGYRCYIQVKNQNGSGTCDEKLSFAFDIAKFGVIQLNCTEFWLVLLGTWWPQNNGIIKFCHRKCDEMRILTQSAGKCVTARVFVGPKPLSTHLNGIGRPQESAGILF